MELCSGVSIKVFHRLELLVFHMLIDGLPDHEERIEIDREIEARTKEYCDVGIYKISDAELKQIVEEVRRRKTRRVEGEEEKVEEIYA